MNGNWLVRGRDGLLSVYLPSDGALLCRTECRPGGPWEAPRQVGGEQKLHPGPAIGQGPAGPAHLVVWRPTAPGESGLVHSTHFRPRHSVLDWTPVGHPERKGDRAGPPALAVDAEGRAHLFVRNGDGGVSLLAQKEKGGWEPWRDLKGHGVQGELAAVTGQSGRVELYAATPDAILHWRQEEPGTRPVLQEAAEVPATPGTLGALATSPRSTTLFYTDESGDLCAWRPGTEPVALLACAGPGPVSAIRCELDGHDCTLLAQRSAAGRVAFAAYPTEVESAGAWWTESGPSLPAGARVAVAEDGEGRVVAASLTEDGELRLARRKDEPGLALTAWQTV
ncbi:hypothetical protein ABZ845_26820 [Streptomyces sp. NPDC047022]|uniref:hypothetical protein n=1 Tax=Streptomyces sp. NPDC047022 TaxID=3155737 RepID=UPI0033E1C2B3